MTNIHCPACHMEFPEEGNDRCPNCARPVDAAGPSAGEERPEGGIKAPVGPLPEPGAGDPPVSLEERAQAALVKGRAAADEAVAEATAAAEGEGTGQIADTTLAEQAAAGDVDAQAQLAEQQGGEEPGTSVETEQEATGATEPPPAT